MALQIKKIVLSDGTELDAAAFANISITSSQNLEIVSHTSVDGAGETIGGKINIEPDDNLAIKPVGKIQIDTNHKATDKKDEMEIAVICDKKSKVEGLKLNVAGIKYVTDGADTSRGWNAETFKVFYKRTTGTTDTYAKVNMHAASFDIRTRSTGAGTGGGIALQIASTDSDGHENKLKFESDRTTAIGTTAQYNGEGGKGLEFGTFNNEHASLYCGDYRFKADAPIFAVTRGAIVEDTTTGKKDYPTQADDFKDIINDSNPITWADLVACVKWYKANH